MIRAERSRNRQVVLEDDTHAALWPTLEQQEPLGTREILVEGSRKARLVAEDTMERVRDAVKLRY